MSWTIQTTHSSPATFSVLPSFTLQNQRPKARGLAADALEVAEPLLKQYAETPEQAETVLMLVVFGWNKSLFPPDKQAAVEKEIRDQLVPKDGSGEAIGMAVHIMDTSAERRETIFPELRKIIVDYEVEIVDDRLTLNVSSAPVPEVA